MKNKVSFFHDHFFIQKNGHVYTSGSLNSSIWDMYSDTLNAEITICARTKNSFDSNQLSSSEHKFVSFLFINSLSNISSLFFKTNEHKNIKNLVLNSDFVIARLPSEIGLYAAKIALEHKIPLLCELVSCPKDSLFYQGSIKAKFYSFILSHRVKKIIYKAENVLYVTNDFLQKRYPNKNYNIAISDVRIDNIRDITLTEQLNKIWGNISKKQIIFGLIGNMSNNIKGIDIAIKALSKLNLNIKFEVVGPGNYQELLLLAKTLNVNISFKGILDKRAVFSWLDTIDIYLQPSRTEGLPRSVIEAMSRGCPVISSNAGGLPEIVHVKATHNKNDADDLLRCINLILKDKNIIEELIIHSFYIAKLYLNNILSQKRTNFYKSIIK